MTLFQIFQIVSGIFIILYFGGAATVFKNDNKRSEKTVPLFTGAISGSAITVAMINMNINYNFNWLWNNLLIIMNTVDIAAIALVIATLIFKNKSDDNKTIICIIVLVAMVTTIIARLVMKG